MKQKSCRIFKDLLVSGLMFMLICFAGLKTASGVEYKEGKHPGSDAIYGIWMPEVWNKNLVLFAHGYVATYLPLSIPEDQMLLKDGTYMPDSFNQLGFAFATTSFSINGLAVKEGINDLCELVKIFNDEYEQPDSVILFGFSQGALITVLALEQFPEVFHGGLAVSGMIGDYQKHTDYMLDFRVVFDYFFPGLIPGSPIAVPLKQILFNWNTIVKNITDEIILNHDNKVQQLLRVADVPIDEEDPTSIAKSIIGLLWLNVISTNDKINKLGGQPFDNTERYYSGSYDDVDLNANIQRFSADQIALDEIKEYYQTSGELSCPLVTIHTTEDPLVKYCQEPFYCKKTRKSGSSSLHENINISRYGHCNFEPIEVQNAFNLLLLPSPV